MAPGQDDVLYQESFDIRGEREATPRGELASYEVATVKLFRETSPSVVQVIILRQMRNGRQLGEAVPAGSGSGFVWDEEGHIVTNFHVAGNADALRVVFDDGEEVDATFVGGTADRDLAVIRIDPKAHELKPIKLGTSHDLEVGQAVLAIGAPLGYSQTLTRGIVSALNREITSLNNHTIKGVVQTDAAINSGNSGGPLLDSGGRLIGVNTQIASRSGGSIGIGFAVPADIVNRVVPQLIEYGQLVKPVLGVQLVPDYVARRNGISGIVVEDVVEGGAAAEAGLVGLQATETGRKAGDIIVAIDDVEVETQKELFDALDERNIGDTVRLRVVRDGEERVVEAVLKSSTEQSPDQQTPDPQTNRP